MADQEFTPTYRSNNFAYKYLKDEWETLLALAIVLENMTAPPDPDNPPEGFDVTQWRLIQVINSRLDDTQFMRHMKMVLIGGQED